MEIIPSILVKTREEFEERVRLVEGHFTTAQLDVADGIFVPNKTADGVAEVEAIDTELLYGVHLMVSKPENHVARWMNLPNVNEICFHFEATQKHREVIAMLRESDVSIGIVLNPPTPHSAVHDLVELVDFVQFMTVNPGFNGAPFLPEVVDKIADFHYYYPDKPIYVDGGVKKDNIDLLEKAGVTKAIVGSAIKDFINV